MNPLKTFNSITKDLIQKPFDFWLQTEKGKLFSSLKASLKRLKSLLEKHALTDTSAYKTLEQVESSISGTSFDEVTFLQQLANLIEIYQLSPADKKQAIFLEHFSDQVKRAKQKILEHHIALEVLENKAKQMTDEEKRQSDLKILQTIGVFYILEYTLYVLYKLSQLSESDRKKIFYEGLKTAEANLPPYTSFAESFRRDLCLKIFDPQLRSKLLRIFFHFEEIFRGGEMQQICTAFHQFNLELLRCFKDHGILEFKAAILAPFGKKLPMEELISKVEDLKI